MYDAILQHKGDIEKSTIVKDLGLAEEIYVVMTLHRPENVDNAERLKKIVSAIVDLEEVKMVFPIHPRTKRRLRNAKLGKVLKRATNVMSTEPLGYFDMLSLMKNSVAVLTDSGGMQKEAFLLHVPCVTLRYNTEWVETVKLEANKLVGAESKRILMETRKILENQDIKMKLESLPNPYGDGKASHKIVKDLKGRFYSEKLAIKTASMIPSNG